MGIYPEGDGGRRVRRRRRRRVSARREPTTADRLNKYTRSNERFARAVSFPVPVVKTSFQFYRVRQPNARVLVPYTSNP